MAMYGGGWGRDIVGAKTHWYYEDTRLSYCYQGGGWRMGELESSVRLDKACSFCWKGLYREFPEVSELLYVKPRGKVSHKEPAEIDGIRYFDASDWYRDLKFNVGDTVRVNVYRLHEWRRIGTVVGINLALGELNSPRGPRPYQVRYEDLEVVHRFHEHELEPFKQI